MWGGKAEVGQIKCVWGGAEVGQIKCGGWAGHDGDTIVWHGIVCQ